MTQRGTDRWIEKSTRRGQRWRSIGGMLTRRNLLGTLCFALLAGCGAPQRDYTVEQIKTVDNLKELMDVQATVADPCFSLRKKLKNKEISDEQWAKFKDMGVRLQATSKRIAKFSKGDQFDEWNATVGHEAKSLVEYVAKRDNAKAMDSVRTIKQTCKACHAEYR